MRTEIDLGGTWRYRCLSWSVMTGPYTFKESTENLPPPGEMEIPCNWELGGLSNFHGRVLFQREFEAPELEAGKRAFLCFQGVDYFCRVILNGKELGEHEGYFQPFEFDVTDFLRAGTNTLEVEVHCPDEEPGTLWPHRKRIIKGILSHWDCRPGSWDGETGQERNSGGIWNRVYLEIRSAAHIRSVRVSSFLLPDEGYQADHADTDVTYGKSTLSTPAERAGAKIIVRASLAGVSPGRHKVEAEVDGHVQAQEVKAGPGSDEVTLIVTLPNAKLWWTWDLGEPHLYDCSVRLIEDGREVDRRTVQFGVREVAVDPDTGQWRLNGRRLFIRGTNVVPTLWLSEYDREKISKDIDLLIAAHINAVRVCVHVNREEFYQACDEAGILIWQDFPLQWSYAEDDAFAMEAARQVREMIRTFYNHPSIAVWTMQNESSFHNKNTLDPILARVGREEDSTRYVRPTSLYREHAYPGWYFGVYADYQSLPGTPILTEFGAQALPSAEEVRGMAGGDTWPPDFEALAYHDFQYDQTFHVARIDLGNSLEEFVRNSQQYQARLLKYAVEKYRRHKYEKLGCMFQFMFVDCWPAITWSVVSYERKPKEGYYVLQEVYQPVLIAADVPRQVVLKGGDKGSHARPLAVKVWIVNDKHESYEGCEYVVALKSEARVVLVARGTVDVPADGIVEIGWVQKDVGDLEEGTWKLELELVHNGGVVSKNGYEITVVAPYTK